MYITTAILSAFFGLQTFTALQHAETAAETIAVQVNEPRPSDFVEVDEQPTVIKKAEPRYPEEAMRTGKEGKVWVKIWVDTQGKPREVSVTKSDAEIFNAATVEAARQFVFTPAKRGGKPIAVWVSVPFKFKLASRETSELTDIVWELLCGKDRAQAKTRVDEDAYVTDGTTYEHLLPVLERNDKGSPFNFEGNRYFSLTTLKLSTDQTLGYVVVKTESEKHKNPRYHTVIFFRSDGQWKIQHWQWGK